MRCDDDDDDDASVAVTVVCTGRMYGAARGRATEPRSMSSSTAAA